MQTGTDAHKKADTTSETSIKHEEDVLKREQTQNSKQKFECSTHRHGFPLTAQSSITFSAI